MFFGGKRFWKRFLIAVGLVGILALLWGPLANLPGNPVTLVSRVRKLLPIYSVDTSEKKVALSFDATWGADYTDQLLAILDQYQVKTTFFLTNKWISKYPDKAKKVADAGHEIGMHSATHPHFPQLSEQVMEEELVENRQMIKEITGYDAKVFRPPYGEYSNTLIQLCDRLGLKVIQWDVDSLDWKDLTAHQMFDRVTKRVKPGSIVLFHNQGKHTAEVLPSLLRWLQAQGYKVVPVSELILPGDTYVDINGVQRQRPQ
ncbi:deacetylase [Clostridiales bacterium PH28_bin88]|nr:deacetylase [Clostridiales bacterium PH28_bin88]